MGNSSSANMIRRPKANLDSSQELQALSASLIHERQSPFIINQEQNSDRIININNHAFVEKRFKYTKDLREPLDPRDKEIIIPFQTYFNISKLQRENKGKTAKVVYQLNGDETKKEIQEMKKESTKLIQSEEYFKMRREIYDYISQVCQNINSIVFQLLNEGKLTENEAKALAAKNILTNVQSILAQVKKKFSQSLLSIAKEIEQLMINLTKSIDGQLNEIMSQLASHYPQATAAGETARMREVITDVNRSQDQTTDLIFANKIDIQKYITSSYYGYYEQGSNKDPQIFTGFIMQVINKAINITKQPFSKQSDQTIFEKFNQFSQSLFSFGQRITTNKCTGDKIIPYFKQILRSSNANKSQQKKQTNPELQKLMYQGTQKSFNFIEEKQSLNNDLQLMRAHHKYGIAQKIPNHVKPFTDVAIQNANFEVHNSSVLRIMTKWAEYLEDIFQKPQVHIMQRVYNFKNLKNEYNIKCMQIKEKICNDLITEYSYVKKSLKEMREKNSLFQSHILSEAETGTTYLKRFTEARSSSTQLNTILIEFTRKYLCVLIHHLIRAGCQSQSINLVMFRVGDLLRSKLQCSESSFINIVKILYMLDSSKEMEGKFKLVRIKNKLNDKDNNILINYMFMGKVQCQLQLSIQDMAKKDKNYYAFTHFLYQLTRGKFGVLTECATIVSQHDPIVNSSKDTYYKPKHYEKIAEGKKPSHSIHIKDKNIYKCWKCHQLVLMENTQLFIRQQTTCNKCISKEKDSQQKFANQDIKGLIQKLKSNKDNEGNNRFQRLDHYGQIEKGKYILSISNRKVKDLNETVKLFRVWYDKNELKLFMVNINNELLTTFHKQKLDFSDIDYLDISNQNKKEEELNEITYKCDKQILIPIFDFMRIYAGFISELDNFFEKFEKFRCQQNIINIIKSKSEIIDLRSNSDKLVALNEITYAYGENELNKLLYKKCNVIDYKYIKTINLKALKLKETPLSLKYMDTSIQINLNQNEISQISFQNQRKLERLEISHNQLGSIDLKNNTALTYLNLKENILASIDLSNNINLTHLYLEGNQLISINLTKNINLTEFSIQNNKLTSIDFSNNLKLTDINLAGNYLTSCICWHLPELSKLLILWNTHSQICQITLLYRKGELKKCQLWGYMVVEELNDIRCGFNNDNCKYSYKVQERA